MATDFFTLSMCSTSSMHAIHSTSTLILKHHHAHTPGYLDCIPQATHIACRHLTCIVPSSTLVGSMLSRIVSKPSHCRDMTPTDKVAWGDEWQHTSHYATATSNQYIIVHNNSAHLYEFYCQTGYLTRPHTLCSKFRFWPHSEMGHQREMLILPKSMKGYMTSKSCFACHAAYEHPTFAQPCLCNPAQPTAFYENTPHAIFWLTQPFKVL